MTTPLEEVVVVVTAVPSDPRHMTCTDVAEFMSMPIGRCVVGRTFVIWCAAPDLAGTIVWGVPDDQDVRDIVKILEFVDHPAISRSRCAIVDGRGLQRLDDDTLHGFMTLTRDRVPGWSDGILRQAVLVPCNLPGFLLVGALASLGPTHPRRFVCDLTDALAFIDHPAAPAAHAAAMKLVVAGRDDAAVIERLRARLAVTLLDATLQDCATTLGLTMRALQRELGRLGTSFSDELRRARVAAAADLLRFTNGKVEAIAVRTGFSNATRMSAALRRELNATPSELRARVRDGGIDPTLRSSRTTT